MKIINNPEEILQDIDNNKPVVALVPNHQGREVRTFVEPFLPFASRLEEKDIQVLFFFVSPEYFGEPLMMKGMDDLVREMRHAYIVNPQDFCNMGFVDAMFLQDWPTRDRLWQIDPKWSYLTFHEHTKVVC